MKKTKKNYEGYYRIARSPEKMKAHNRVSWEKIENLSSSTSDGKMDFDHLSKLVENHQHGTKGARYPYQFITYCVKKGWLERV